MSLVKKYRKQFAATALTIGAIVSNPIDVHAAAVEEQTVSDAVDSGKALDNSTGSTTIPSLEQIVTILEKFKALATSDILGINVSETAHYITTADKAVFENVNKVPAEDATIFEQLATIKTKLEGLIKADGATGSLSGITLKPGTQESYQTAVTSLITNITAAYNMLADGNIFISYTNKGDDLPKDTDYVTLEQYNDLKTAIQEAVDTLVLAHDTHYNDESNTQSLAFDALIDLASGTNDAAGDGDAFAKLFGEDLAIAGTDTTHKTLAEINTVTTGTADGTGTAGLIAAYDSADAYATVKAAADGAIIVERAEIEFDLKKGKAALGLDPTQPVPAGSLAVDGFTHATKTFIITPPASDAAGSVDLLIDPGDFVEANAIYAPKVVADGTTPDKVGSTNHDMDDGSTPEKQLNYVTLSEANATLAELRALEAKLLDYDGLDDAKPYKEDTGAANSLTLYTAENVTNEINKDTLKNLKDVNTSITDALEAFENKQKVGTGANKDSRAARIAALLNYISFATFENSDKSEIGGLAGGAWATGISAMNFIPDIELDDMDDYSGDDTAAPSGGDAFAKKTVSLLYGIDVPAATKWVTPTVHDALYNAAKEARKQYELYKGAAYDGSTAKYVNAAESKAQTLEDLEDAASALNDAITAYEAEAGFDGKKETFIAATEQLSNSGGTGALDLARDLVNPDGTFNNGGAGEKHYISEYGIVHDGATAFAADDKWATQANVNTFNDVLLPADKIKAAVAAFTVDYTIPTTGDKDQIDLIKEIVASFGDKDGEYKDTGYFKDAAKEVTDAQADFAEQIHGENYIALFGDGGSTTGEVAKLTTAIGTPAVPDESITATGARGLLAEDIKFGETAPTSKIYISEDGYLYATSDGAPANTLIPAGTSGDTKWVPLAAATAFETVIDNVEAKKTLLEGLKTKAESALTAEEKALLAQIINDENNFALNVDYFDGLVEELSEDATEEFTDAATVTTETSDALHAEIAAFTTPLNTAITEKLYSDATNADKPVLHEPVDPGNKDGISTTIAISNNGLTAEDGTALVSGITQYITRTNFDAFANTIVDAITLRDESDAKKVKAYKDDKSYLATAKADVESATTAYTAALKAILTTDFTDEYASFFTDASTGVLSEARATLTTAGKPAEDTVVESENGLTYLVGSTVTKIDKDTIDNYVTKATIDEFQAVLKPADEIQVAIELFKAKGNAIPSVGDSFDVKIVNDGTGTETKEVTVTKAHINKINEILTAFEADNTFFTKENSKITDAQAVYDGKKIAENVTKLETYTNATPDGTFDAAITAGRTLLAEDTKYGETAPASTIYISKDGKVYDSNNDGIFELLTNGAKYVTPTEVATFEQALDIAESLQTKLSDVTKLDKATIDALIKDDGTFNDDYFTASPAGATTKVTVAKTAFDAAAAKTANTSAFTSAYDAFKNTIVTAMSGNLLKADGTAPDGTETDFTTLKPLATIFISEDGITGYPTSGSPSKYVTNNDFRDLINAIKSAIEIREQTPEQLITYYEHDNTYFDKYVTRLTDAVATYTAAQKAEKKTGYDTAIKTAFGEVTTASTKILEKLPIAGTTGSDKVTYEVADITDSSDLATFDIKTLVISEDGGFTINGESTAVTTEWITKKMNDDLKDAIQDLEDIRKDALDYDSKQIRAYLAAADEAGVSTYFADLITGTEAAPTDLEEAIEAFKPAPNSNSELTTQKDNLAKLLAAGEITLGDGTTKFTPDATTSVKFLYDSFKGVAADGSDKRISDLGGIDTLTFTKLEHLNGDALGSLNGNATPADYEKYYKYVTSKTANALNSVITTAQAYYDKITVSGYKPVKSEIDDIKEQITILKDAMPVFNGEIKDLETAPNARQKLYDKVVAAEAKKFTLVDGTKTAVEKSDLGGVDIEEGVSWVTGAIYNRYNTEVQKALNVLKDRNGNDTAALKATGLTLNNSIKALDATTWYKPVVSEGNTEYTGAKDDMIDALNTLLVELGYSALADMNASDNEAGDANASEITAEDIAAFKALTAPNGAGPTAPTTLYVPSLRFGIETTPDKLWIPKLEFDAQIAKLKTYATTITSSLTPTATFEKNTVEIGKVSALFEGSKYANNHGTKYDESIQPEKSFKYLLDEITKYGAIIDGSKAGYDPTATDYLPKLVGTTDQGIKDANNKAVLTSSTFYFGDVALDPDKGSHTAPANYWGSKLELQTLVTLYNTAVKWALNTDNLYLIDGDEIVKKSFTALKTDHDKIKAEFEKVYGVDIAGNAITDEDGNKISKLHKGVNGEEHKAITESIRIANEWMNELNYLHSSTVPTTLYTLENGTPNQKYTDKESGEIYVSGLLDGADVPAGATWYTQKEINDYVLTIKKAQDALDLFERNPNTAKKASLDVAETALKNMTTKLTNPDTLKVSDGNGDYTNSFDNLNDAIEIAYLRIGYDPLTGKPKEVSTLAALPGGETVIRLSYNGEGAEATADEKWVGALTYNNYVKAIETAKLGIDKKGGTIASLNSTLATLDKATAAIKKAATKPGTKTDFESERDKLVDAIKAADTLLMETAISVQGGADIPSDQKWVTSVNYNYLKTAYNAAISAYDKSYGSTNAGLTTQVTASKADATAPNLKTVKKSGLTTNITNLTKYSVAFENAKEGTATNAEDIAVAKEALRVAAIEFNKDKSSIVGSPNRNGTDVSENSAWVSGADKITVTLTGGALSKTFNNQPIKTILDTGYNDALTASNAKIMVSDTTTQDQLDAMEQKFIDAKALLDNYRSQILTPILNGTTAGTLVEDIAGNAGSLEAVAAARATLTTKIAEADAAVKGVYSIDIDGATGQALLDKIKNVSDGQYYASPTDLKTFNDTIAAAKKVNNQKITAVVAGELKKASDVDALNAEITALGDASAGAIKDFNAAKVLVKRSMTGGTGTPGDGGVTPFSIEVVTLSMGDGSEIILEQQVPTPVGPTTPGIILPTIELPVIAPNDNFLEMEEEIFEELVPELDLPESGIPEIEIPDLELPEIEIPELEEYPVMPIPELGEYPVMPIPEEEYIEEEYIEEEYYEEEYIEEEYYEEEYYEEEYVEEEYYEEVIEEVYEEIYEEVIEEIEIEDIEVEEIIIEDIEIDEIEVEEITIEEVSAKKSMFAKLFSKIFKS